ncbi:MAG: hypothetical protein KGO96_04785 [Elusimicrobia bacterium]|nr:hypothetical protein [Elusimicrobiota bacterium]MDE2425207.1 hypothetical protein [Elusimicrobiota bacterium]
MRTRARALVLAAAFVTAETAAGPAAAPRFARADLLAAPICRTRDSLLLCPSPQEAPLSLERRPQAAGGLTAFARLAGMFMGRVDALAMGPFRLRLKLEVR